MSDPCEFKKEILELKTDMSEVRTDIKHTLDYIRSGAKYRLTVICACLGLVGTFLGAWIKFSVNDYRLGRTEADVEQIKTQVYDMNYVKGQQSGYVQSKNEHIEI